MNGKTKDGLLTNFLLVIVIILIIVSISLQIFSIFQSEDIQTEEKGSFQGNVAVIQIKGGIVTDELPSDEGYVTASSKIVSLIEKASKDENLKVILVEINSNGGSGFAALEIAKALQQVNKTKIAWVREKGVSAAYLIATYTDRIIADKLSDVGSIGVIIEYEILNITHETVKAGAYKDIYSPYRPLSEEEKKIVQQNVNLQHEIFIEEVAKNRKLRVSEVRKIADGLSYLGQKAKELGLIDELGGKDEVLNFIRKRENIEPVLAYYNFDSGNFDIAESQIQVSNENDYE